MKKFVVIQEGRTNTAPIRINDFIALMKHQYRSPEALIERFPDVLVGSIADIVADFWGEVQPYPVADMFAIKGLQTRRFFWASMGPNTIFNALEDKELIATDSYKAVHPTRGEYEDIVELWDIRDQRIPTEERRLAAVRVVCPSTGNTYPLYIDHRSDEFQRRDALGALCTLIWSPYPIEKLQAIKRQGEVYFFRVPNGTKRLDTLLNVSKADFIRLVGEQS
jgi:hypothetical protein